MNADKLTVAFIVAVVTILVIAVVFGLVISGYILRNPFTLALGISMMCAVSSYVTGALTSKDR